MAFSKSLNTQKKMKNKIDNSEIVYLKSVEVQVFGFSIGRDRRIFVIVEFGLKHCQLNGCELITERAA